MAPDGPRKAAMLLTWLGPETGAELLKEASPETVTRIAAELAYLDATGQNDDANAAECVQEFFVMLNEQQKGEVRGEEFLQEILRSVMGEQEVPELLGQVRQMVLARDPFLQVRSAEVEDIAGALRGEGARVASLVLAELPPRKSAELLALLPEEIRVQALEGVTRGEEVTPEARLRVAVVVMSRLEGVGGAARPESVREQQQLRKAALILRKLPTDLRDTMLQQIAQADSTVGEKVTKLMVIWEDLPDVAARALQEALRSLDARKLALALFDADEQAVDKIRKNSSERMNALIDEEISLLSSPKLEEILAAREEILEVLRQMNSSGDLSFEDEQETP